MRLILISLIYPQVQWDETSSVPRPDRVSPWKIEPALSPMNPLPVARPKRPRPQSIPLSSESSVLIRSGMLPASMTSEILTVFLWKKV